MTSREEQVTARPVLLVRFGPVAWRFDRRSTLVAWVLAGVVAVLAVAALAAGDFVLTPGEVVSALLGREDGLVRTVVWDWRLPRVAAAVVLGAGLGASGAVFQSLTRNPLASPDVLGFSTGAYTGALLALITVGGGFAGTAAGAFVGGLATAAVIYLLAYRDGVQGFRLIVVGIAVASLLGSVNTWLMLTANLQVAMSAVVWGSGSLAGVTSGRVTAAAALTGLLGLALVGLLRRLRCLELGDDAAAALGADVQRSRLLLMVVAVGLTAVATAVAGPIMFVALVAPQVAARLTGSAALPVGASACLGAVLLLAADYVALHLLGDAVMPVGVVTVTLGGGYLVWLLVREARQKRTG